MSNEQDVNKSVELAKQAIFYLNKALCELNTSKPRDLLKLTYVKDEEPLDAIRFFYTTITDCIESASQIRDGLMKLELYNLPIGRTHGKKEEQQHQRVPERYELSRGDIPSGVEETDEDTDTNPEVVPPQETMEI